MNGLHMGTATATHFNPVDEWRATHFKLGPSRVHVFAGHDSGFSAQHRSSFTCDVRR